MCSKKSSRIEDYYPICYSEDRIYDWSLKEAFNNDLSRSSEFVALLSKHNFINEEAKINEQVHLGQVLLKIAKLSTKHGDVIEKLQNYRKEFYEYFQHGIPNFQESESNQVVDKLYQLALKEVNPFDPEAANWIPVLPLLRESLVEVEHLLQAMFKCINYKIDINAGNAWFSDARSATKATNEIGQYLFAYFDRARKQMAPVVCKNWLKIMQQANGAYSVAQNQNLLSVSGLFGYNPEISNQQTQQVQSKAKSENLSVTHENIVGIHTSAVFETLIEKAVKVPNANSMVMIVFTELNAAKQFQGELLKIGFGNPDMKGELRKINLSDQPGHNEFTIELTADEYNSILQDDNAYAKLVTSAQSRQMKS